MDFHQRSKKLTTRVNKWKKLATSDGIPSDIKEADNQGQQWWKKPSDIKEARASGPDADGSFPSNLIPSINYISDDQGILMMIMPSLIIKGPDDDQAISDDQGFLMMIKPNFVGGFWQSSLPCLAT